MLLKLSPYFRSNFAKKGQCSGSRFREMIGQTICPLIGRFVFFRPIYLLPVSVIALIIGELLIPHLSYSEWPETLQQVELLKKDKTVRILFLGNVELMTTGNGLAQWDADRFLEETYLKAVSVVKPDIILAIGDLFPSQAPSSRESADETLLRFSRIFRTQEMVEKKGIIFSISLGELDASFLSGACNPECSNLVQNVYKEKLISPHCHFYANGSILVRRFYSSSDKTDDPPCNNDEKSNIIRIVIQQEPILPAMLSMFRSSGLGPGLVFVMDQKTVSIVRDFAPQLVVTSRGGHSGVAFCTNCMSIGAGGQPYYPNLEWLPVGHGTKPLTFRMPSPLDGGGRGGMQPHISLPPASYRAQMSHFFRNSHFIISKTGYGFGVIDLETSQISYAVLWNYDRGLVVQLYIFLVYLAILRLAVFFLLKIYFHFDHFLWQLAAKLTNRCLLNRNVVF